ncbi:D-aminoacyl-tRNA deacylase [Halobellus rubicundus]|uniref:D-aminoacyl-tRNA deacylase n=1 Tax=Halobellus rubicundus TaxID=2996466 RepID=A0ABD5MB64_9EURY
MIGLVVSRADDASVAIGEALRSLVDWEARTDDARSDADGGGTYYRHGDFELRTFEEWHLELSGVADAFSTEPEFVAFLSRHAGETGPLLTAHFTGNFGPAEFGGERGELARACPNVQRAILAAFDRHAPDGYDVGIECTHHGPSDVGAPSLFVELGSSESEWSDPDGAEAVARAVLELSGVGADAEAAESESESEPPQRRHVVGFGGGHYAPQFERVLRETDWRVGHVAADWVRQSMGAPEANAEIVHRAFAQSAATRALVADGDSGSDSDLRAVIEDLGYRVVDETWLRVTSGVDLALVDALDGADDLDSIDDGLRFGAPAEAASSSAADAVTVVPLPDDLLAEAAGIDREATFDAVAERVLAFETVEGGTKPRGRAAVTDADSLDALVDAVCRILREKYDDVAATDREVAATRETFDPAAAAEAGVPEGPAFGRLAAGEAVEVDGREVAPEEVRTTETARFPLPEPDISSESAPGVGSAADFE